MTHSYAKPRRLGLWLVVVVGLLVPSAPSFAQIPDFLNNLQGISASGKTPAALSVEARLSAETPKAGAIAQLEVEATIPQGFALYSMDPSFSRPTKIALVATPGLEPAGKFTPSHAPKRSFDEIFDKELEKFTGTITWTRPMRIVDPAKAAVKGTFNGTYCSSGAGGTCRLASEEFTATLAQATTPQATTTAKSSPQPEQATSDQTTSEQTTSKQATPEPEEATFEIVKRPQLLGKPKPGPAQVRVALAPQSASPDETVTLTVTMTLDEGWHTYSTTMTPGAGGLPTRIQLERAAGLTPIGEEFTADHPPKQVPLAGTDGERILQEYTGTVVWTRQFRVDDTDYGVAGKISYLTCRDGRCLSPRTIKFALGNLEKAGEVPPPIASSGGTTIASSGSAGTTVTPGSAPPAGGSGFSNQLAMYLAVAFLGGLILNFMPCVLPVVAIKVMGFVQHAGQRRSHIFVLNSAYAGGVIFVFLVLATITALPQFVVGASDWLGIDLFGLIGFSDAGATWGGLFQSRIFTVVMVSVVFVMGLSLFGVYEIPIPGMVGSAAGASQLEGFPGAFMMGIFTTLLATPCLGPFLGTTLGWTLQQPPGVVYAIWGTMGLGMASPYLVFGLVPGAVKLLPKPGNWMVTLKQFAGFVLMATVIWLMQSLKGYLIPMSVALLGMAIGCWMYGLVQGRGTRGKRWSMATAALLVAAMGAYLGYGLTVVSDDTLAWKPFSTEKVEQLVSQEKTVLVDFTADWCANCKVNEARALNTAETKALMEKHGIVPLVADFTHGSTEIREWLDRFGAIGIPLTVIFPGGNADEPIVLRGMYSQSTLLESLKKAVTPAGAKSAAAPSSATVRR